MRYVQVNNQTNLIVNAIELDATVQAGNNPTQSAWICPTGFSLYQSDTGNLNDAWPLVTQPTS